MQRQKFALSRAATRLCALATLVTACSGQEGASPDAGVGDNSGALGPVTAVDVLVVVDNSGSMANEQAKLQRELPRLVQILISGDKYAGETAPPEVPPEQRFFNPVKSLHLGLVSTNMGGVESIPSNSLEAVVSCSNLGDDGQLQHNTSVATTGVVESRGGRNPEFPGFEWGEVVIAPDPTCAIEAPLYHEYEAVEGDAAGNQVRAAALADSFRCAARLGVRGCPFEQPLEAMWKALAPSDGRGDLFTFMDQSKGHGSTLHQGFLRSEAALAVVIITDEDDCSITETGRGLFALDLDAKDEYGPINLRCGLHVDDMRLVRPTQRYVDGLKSLKPGHPERIFLALLAGIPISAVGTPIASILALPDLQFREAPPEGSGLPATSCVGHDMGHVEEAYPPRRLLQVAQAFEPQAVVDSICADSYRPPMDLMLADLANLMGSRDPNAPIAP